MARLHYKNKKGVPISWDAPGRVPALLCLDLTRCLVRFVGQIEEHVEEGLRLARGRRDPAAASESDGAVRAGGRRAELVLIE